MENYRRSIRMKILFSTLFVLLLLALTLGGSSVLVVHRLAQADSEQLMIQRCEEEALRFDNKLNLVRHSVRMVYQYACELAELGQFDQLSEEYEARVKDMALSVANDTSGAIAVYFRYNPQLVGNGTSGFFWSRKYADAPFTEEPPTDILAYNASDVEHVGWYYTPKETGSPLWMTPYYNKNLDVLMISYIIPLYSDNGDFIGVIGMDIDFNSIMNAAGSVTLYETGRLALVDLSERIIYYCDENGNAADEHLSHKLYNHVTTINKDSELLVLTDAEGNESFSCCKRLSNGMILYLSVPLREINANRNYLMRLMALVTVLICSVSMLIVWRNTSALIQPIRRLAMVANSYAKGKWDEKYICSSGDELQELSESISIMAAQTKEYIERLEILSRIDALTGIRNKLSYMELTEEIRENRRGMYDHYALAVMDLNSLKRTNDSLGHEVGDALIKAAGKYICSTFRHSPVFRIGGDEFVAVLMGEDYTNRVSLVTRFEQGLGYDVSGVSLSISWGVADADEGDRDPELVFKLADDRMYEKKAEIHRHWGASNP